MYCKTYSDIIFLKQTIVWGCQFMDDQDDSLTSEQPGSSETFLNQ